MQKQFVPLTIAIFCLGMACSSSKRLAKAPQEEPRPSSFWYYQKDFQLDSLSLLKSKGLYFRIIDADQFGEIYKLFRFYPDGMVMAYVVYNTPDKVAQLERVSKGNIHGFYTTRQDSVFFTTKVYYEHSPVFYDGQIFKDSLVLHSKNYKTKQEATHTYYLYKDH